MRGQSGRSGDSEDSKTNKDVFLHAQLLWSGKTRQSGAKLPQSDFVPNRSESRFSEVADCRWVCECHPERSREGPHACGCGGAGMPCPICNPSDGLTPPRMPRGFVEDEDVGTRHWSSPRPARTCSLRTARGVWCAYWLWRSCWSARSLRRRRHTLKRTIQTTRFAYRAAHWGAARSSVTTRRWRNAMRLRQAVRPNATPIHFLGLDIRSHIAEAIDGNTAEIKIASAGARPAFRVGKPPRAREAITRHIAALVHLNPQGVAASRSAKCLWFPVKTHGIKFNLMES